MYHIAFLSAENLHFLTGVFLHFITGADTACELLKDTEMAQREEEIRRNTILKEAFSLITNPEKYRGEIIDRPDSKAGAIEHLTSDAVAFQFVLLRGDDCGKNLLAFTQESLLRLLARVGCGKELYAAFLALCEVNGVLDKRKRTIKLGLDEINAVTFLIKK